MTPNRQGRSTALVMPIRCRPRRKVHRWQSKDEGGESRATRRVPAWTANASVSRPGPEQSVFRSVATARLCILFEFHTGSIARTKQRLPCGRPRSEPVDPVGIDRH